MALACVPNGSTNSTCCRSRGLQTDPHTPAATLVGPAWAANRFFCAHLPPTQIAFDFGTEEFNRRPFFCVLLCFPQQRYTCRRAEIVRCPKK